MLGMKEEESAAYWRDRVSIRAVLSPAAHKQEALTFGKLSSLEPAWGPVPSPPRTCLSHTPVYTASHTQTLTTCLATAGTRWTADG